MASERDLRSVMRSVRGLVLTAAVAMPLGALAVYFLPGASQQAPVAGTGAAAIPTAAAWADAQAGAGTGAQAGAGTGAQAGAGTGADGQAAAPHGVAGPQVEAMIERLDARLRRSPEDVEGWVMLGRSQAALGRFVPAARAYAEAAARAPGDARLLADYADVLAMTQGGSLAGEPAALVARALAIDPGDPKALALAGTLAFERRDYGAAIGHWERALAALPEDSDWGRRMRENLEEARASLASGPLGAARTLDALGILADPAAPAGAPSSTRPRQLR